jgi:hypothetical protein
MENRMRKASTKFRQEISPESRFVASVNVPSSRASQPRHSDAIWVNDPIYFFANVNTD